MLRVECNRTSATRWRFIRPNQACSNQIKPNKGKKWRPAPPTCAPTAGCSGERLGHIVFTYIKECKPLATTRHPPIKTSDKIITRTPKTLKRLPASLSFAHSPATSMAIPSPKTTNGINNIINERCGLTPGFVAHANLHHLDEFRLNSGDDSGELVRPHGSYLKIGQRKLATTSAEAKKLTGAIKIKR